MKNLIIIHKKTLIFLLAIVLFIYIGVGIKNFPIEEVYPISGIGYDYDENSKYNIPVNVYRYKGEDKIIYSNITGVADTLGATRQTRQLKMDKTFKLGTERVLVISENQARSGIREILNILFINPEINDSVTTVVCKGKARDILSFKIKEEVSSAEYLDGMIKNAESFNFLSREYNLIKAYTKVESEGESLSIPYIEIEDDDLIYSGMVIFNKDKMVDIVKGEESNIFNILRHRRGTGVITLQEEDGKALNYITKVKRKVDCDKKDGQYKFTIKLDFVGDILVNNLYKDIDKKSQKEIEDKLKQHIENESYIFIKKLREEIKIDCLELGMQAASKYGRDTGVDWNKIIIGSDIKVIVNLKISKIGRGQY